MLFFLFSIISKAGLEKSEDFSRPALFLETYVTASFTGFIIMSHRLWLLEILCRAIIGTLPNSQNKDGTNNQDTAQNVEPTEADTE